MKKIKKVLLVIGNIFLYGVPIIYVFYLLVISIRPHIPLPLFMMANKSLIILLRYGYLFFLPIFVFSKKLNIFRGIIIFALLPYYLATYLSIRSFPETIIDIVVQDESNFYLTAEEDSGDRFISYSLYKCNFKSLDCLLLVEKSGPNYDWGADLILDQNQNELHFIQSFVGYKTLVYTYALISRDYITQIDSGEYFYTLAETGEEPNIDSKYFLYQCKKDFSSCHQLPFLYELISSESPVPMYFESADGNQEIQLFDKHGSIIYSYGDAPKCYVEGCSIPQD